MPGQSLDYSKQTEGDGRFLPPSHTPSQANPQRPLAPGQDQQPSAGPTHSLIHAHTPSLLAGLDDLDVLVGGSTGPTAGGRLRRQHASAFTKHRGSVIIHDDSGFFQVISSCCLAAANNDGAIGTAGTARRWTAWGLGARSVNLTIDPMCVCWGHVLGAFGGTRDHGTNSRQLTARRSRSHGSGAEFG